MSFKAITPNGVQSPSVARPHTNTILAEITLEVACHGRICAGRNRLPSANTPNINRLLSTASNLRPNHVMVLAHTLHYISTVAWPLAAALLAESMLMVVGHGWVSPERSGGTVWLLYGDARQRRRKLMPVGASALTGTY